MIAASPRAELEDGSARDTLRTQGPSFHLPTVADGPALNPFIKYSAAFKNLVIVLSAAAVADPRARAVMCFDPR